MGKYLLRRILQMIPVVLGTTLLVYALVFALPGDPVKAMFGDKPVNEAVAAQIRAEYHLDQLFIVQYFIYLKNALTLNFGDTFAGQPVLDEITRAFPVTIRLGLMAFVFEAIFGVVFGIISGLKKGKWYDTVILIVSLLLISVPTFVTGFVMQYVFGIQWAYCRCGRRRPGFLDLLMPAMVLGSVSMAYIIRPDPLRNLLQHRRGLRAHRTRQGHVERSGHAAPRACVTTLDSSRHLPRPGHRRPDRVVP